MSQASRNQRKGFRAAISSCAGFLNAARWAVGVAHAGRRRCINWRRARVSGSTWPAAGTERPIAHAGGAVPAIRRFSAPPVGGRKILVEIDAACVSMQAGRLTDRNYWNYCWRNTAARLCCSRGQGNVVAAPFSSPRVPAIRRPLRRRRKVQALGRCLPGVSGPRSKRSYTEFSLRLLFIKAAQA